MLAEWCIFTCACVHACVGGHWWRYLGGSRHWVRVRHREHVSFGVYVGARVWCGTNTSRMSGPLLNVGASLQSIAVRRCSSFGITARLLVDEWQRCQCCVACCKLVPYVRPGASDLSHALARAVINGRPWPDGSPKTERNHATGHQFSQSVHPSQATSTTGKPRREATQAGNPREGPHGAIRPRATQPPAATTEKN